MRVTECAIIMVSVDYQKHYIFLTLHCSCCFNSIFPLMIILNNESPLSMCPIHFLCTFVSYFAHNKRLRKWIGHMLTC